MRFLEVTPSKLSLVGIEMLIQATEKESLLFKFIADKYV